MRGEIPQIIPEGYSEPLDYVQVMGTVEPSLGKSVLYKTVQAFVHPYTSGNERVKAKQGLQTPSEDYLQDMNLTMYGDILAGRTFYEFGKQKGKVEVRYGSPVSLHTLEISTNRKDLIVVHVDKHGTVALAHLFYSTEGQLYAVSSGQDTLSDMSDLHQYLREMEVQHLKKNPLLSEQQLDDFHTTDLMRWKKNYEGTLPEAEFVPPEGMVYFYKNNDAFWDRKTSDKYPLEVNSTYAYFGEQYTYREDKIHNQGTVVVVRENGRVKTISFPLQIGALAYQELCDRESFMWVQFPWIRDLSVEFSQSSA